MFAAMKTAWARHQLKDPSYTYLFDGHPDEYVSVDCETTSLDPKKAEVLSIGAVKMRGNRILTSESFYTLVKPKGILEGANVSVHGLRPMDVSQGVPPLEAVKAFLDFAGGRPLVGYYMAYDAAVLNKYVKQLIGIHLPNPKIEVSGLYYDWQLKKNPEAYIDLHLQNILDGLNIPTLARHNALNDAITAAMILLAMRQRGGKA